MGVVKKFAVVAAAISLAGGNPAAGQNFILDLFKGETVDMQAFYEQMPELTPVVVYMRPESTSGVEAETVARVDAEIKNQMITGTTFKPVSMEKWLASKYGGDKASSVFQLVRDLKEERYPVNITGICKPYVYRMGKETVVKVSVFPFSRGGYPVTSVRVIKSDREIAEAVGHLLSELSQLMAADGGETVRMAVEPFSIQCRTLIEQKTGEFDFISTSFSSQEGVELKSTDDYFSELFAYQAQCTGLFSATTTQNIDGYVSTEPSRSTAYSADADYLVKGDIILSDRLNVMTVHLIDTKTGRTARTARHIMRTLTLRELWNMNYGIISDFCEVLFRQEDVKTVGNIDNEGRCFYMNGMFAGFDSIERIPVRTGKTVINTGTRLASDVSVNSGIANGKDNRDYFIYTNNDDTFIYKGREGEYVWNLLEK